MRRSFASNRKIIDFPYDHGETLRTACFAVQTWCFREKKRFWRPHSAATDLAEIWCKATVVGSHSMNKPANGNPENTPNAI